MGELRRQSDIELFLQFLKKSKCEVKVLGKNLGLHECIASKGIKSKKIKKTMRSIFPLKIFFNPSMKLRF